MARRRGLGVSGAGRRRLGAVLLLASARAATPPPSLPDGAQVCGEEGANGTWADFCTWLHQDCGTPVMGRYYQATFEKQGAPVKGIGTTCPIAAGKLFACVPERCCITTPSKEVVDAMPNSICNDSRASLAIHMAEEARKGDASGFAAYLRALPTEEDFRRYHPAYIQALVNLVRIQTRRFEEVEMAPLADMTNSAPALEINAQPESARFVTERRFCLRATRDLLPGEEILTDYEAASAPALAFFSAFGFALGPGDHTPDGGMCHGLREHELDDPGPEPDPVHANVWRFAKRFCQRSEWKPKGRRR